MEQLHTLGDLEKRMKIKRPTDIPTIVISAGTCGQASGANELIRATKREILAKGLNDTIQLRITGCHGFCQMEPSLLIEPRETFYPKVSTKDIPRIIDATAQGKAVHDLLWLDLDTGERIERMDDIPFFRSQLRTILARNEKIDPIRINDYFLNGGYGSLYKILKRSDPLWVIEEMKTSGLRGRGGAGFPTGKKWELLSKQPSDKGKYLICNADEGDPGAYMDRSILEGNPHSIIEGMIIGAFATGATKGYVYVRYEYPLAIKHLTIAIRQARELGILGENILGTGFSFDIQLVKGAGAFVCGEETALIRSIEGSMGEPRQRPPYPIERGLYGKPSAINNVETWANIPIIFDQGARFYSHIGTPGNSGTKIFSLVGKIKNTGLVEVPMGTTIRDIVYHIGGGGSGNTPIKAIQTGGPSGGCIPADKFDLPIDYDSLSKAGSIMGSGGMIVMDERSCMVDIAKYFMNFLKDESCGKCFSCRKGTQRMYEILEDISNGTATLAHLDLLEELALVVADTSMCGLGQTAANPVLSTLHYFREEFIEHIVDKKCRAGVCKELVGAPCHSACPIGTEAWRYVAHIARGEYEDAYKVIREVNPFPSICARVCDHQCEEMCRLGTTGNRSVAIRALKRFVTDHVDPKVYKPKYEKTKKDKKVAIVGSGPAGLTAAHNLSLMGYPVTVFETETQAGGMLYSCIPEYRLPHDVLKKEIDAIFDSNVTFAPNKELGRDFSLDGILHDGYDAVFVGIGAQKGKRLQLESEDNENVFPSIEFLKNYNENGKEKASGRVVVIGGGNSAVDAARTALRQKGVESVTILYRRSREEMPAFAEEVDAAIEEGVKLETLVAPVRIKTEKNRLICIELIRNRLGEVDSSGRRRPVPIPGSEFSVPLDTMVVAISESPDVNSISVEGELELKIKNDGTVEADKRTLRCSRPGVFAGGDVITGPNTVIDAIAAGKRAATMIDRYLRGEKLEQPEPPRKPTVYVEPVLTDEDELAKLRRAEIPRVSPEVRRKSFREVEQTLSEPLARKEAVRCLRCDLEFTEKCRHKETEVKESARQSI